MTINKQLNEEDILTQSNTVTGNKKGKAKSVHPKAKALTNIDIDSTLYMRQYNKIATMVIEADFQVDIKWDLILFFTNLLKDRSTSSTKKRELISFL
jgi:hypothetical protein